MEFFIRRFLPVKWRIETPMRDALPATTQRDQPVTDEGLAIRMDMGKVADIGLDYVKDSFRVMSLTMGLTTLETEDLEAHQRYSTIRGLQAMVVKWGQGRSSRTPAINETWRKLALAPNAMRYIVLSAVREISSQNVHITITQLSGEGNCDKDSLWWSWRRPIILYITSEGFVGYCAMCITFT